MEIQTETANTELKILLFPYVLHYYHYKFIQEIRLLSFQITTLPKLLFSKYWQEKWNLIQEAMNGE